MMRQNPDLALRRPPLTYLSIHFFFNAIVFFFMMPRLDCSNIDPYFKACNVPKSCGDGQNISFPFYIANQQESFCGFPGFELNCDTRSENPVLKLRHKDYVVHHISYSDQTLRVSNAVLSGRDGNGNGSSVCGSGSEMPKNFSFPEEKFQLVSNKTRVFLFYNCNLTGVPGNVLPYKIGDCGAGTDKAGNNSTLAIYDDQASVLGLAEARCGRSVVMPVEHRRGGEGLRASIEQELRDGFWLKWIASNCSVCEHSGGKCGFNQTIWHFRCFCPDRPHAWWCAPRSPSDHDNIESMRLGLGIGGTVILIIILVALLIIKPCFRRNTSNLISRNISAGPSSKSDIETSNVYLRIPIFSNKELEEATNNFSGDKLLGDGGFGTVYYGKLRDGREVAVKRLYEHNFRRVEQFMNEIEILTRMQHKNLVSLYGCTSRRSRELLLVYEFVPNGTLADHLHGHLAKPGSLTWPVRMSIAIETASALAYLHASDIIHRDVKTNNILLDRNFNVKVADFGLSRLFPNDVTHVSTAPQGTPGYVDPEYHQCYHLTNKSDVYSFGVVLVELMSSMPAVDMNRNKTEINLSNLAINKIQKHAFHELIDPNLSYETNDEVRNMMRLVAELAFQSLQQDKDMRPTMQEVAQELKRIQNGEFTFHVQEENQNDNEEVKRITPPLSPENWDEALLLKNIRLPPSPISVTEQWISRSTTPNTSREGIVRSFPC